MRGECEMQKFAILIPCSSRVKKRVSERVSPRLVFLRELFWNNKKSDVYFFLYGFKCALY